MAFVCYTITLLLNVFWLWLGDGLSVERQMLIPVIGVAVAAAGVWLRTRTMTAAGRRSYRRRAMWVLLIYYLAILSVLLFFGVLFYLDRVWGGPVNLKPFYTIRNFLVHYRRTGSLSSLFNLLGNIAILVPLGVLLPVMFRSMRRFWIFLPLVAGIAVGIEYLQWCTATGIADVDDSVLNFIGAAAGYFVTRLCQLIYHLIRKRTKLE